MKILALDSSPRRGGNSATLTTHFLDKAESLGAEVERHSLNKLRYRGCQACDGCRQGPETPCVLQDDLTGILAAIHEADVLVLASPVYFGDVTAQLKGFIDRCRSLLKPDFKTNPVPGRLAPGKQIVFILVQAQSETSAYADIYPRYWYFFKYFNFAKSHLIRACGVREHGAIQEKPELLLAAENLAVQIVENSPS